MDAPKHLFPLTNRKPNNSRTRILMDYYVLAPRYWNRSAQPILSPKNWEKRKDDNGNTEKLKRVTGLAQSLEDLLPKNEAKHNIFRKEK